MPTGSIGRPILTDLLKGYDTYRDEVFVDDIFETVTIGGTGSIGNIGIPLVWVDGNSRFEVFVDQDISAVSGSPLKKGYPVCVLVGNSFGVGQNRADTDISADTTGVALVSGKATIVDEGMVWGTANSTNQALFLAQLGLQDVSVTSEATTVTPSYLA